MEIELGKQGLCTGLTPRSVNRQTIISVMGLSAQTLDFPPFYLDGISRRIDLRLLFVGTCACCD